MTEEEKKEVNEGSKKTSMISRGGKGLDIIKEENEVNEQKKEVIFSVLNHPPRAAKIKLKSKKIKMQKTRMAIKMLTFPTMYLYLEISYFIERFRV